MSKRAVLEAMESLDATYRRQTNEQLLSRAVLALAEYTRRGNKGLIHASLAAQDELQRLRDIRDVARSMGAVFADDDLLGDAHGGSSE